MALIVAIFGKCPRHFKVLNSHFQDKLLEVSIFLPTLNEELHISRKLDNLLSQSYPIKEILVYDCSTDRTTEIVRKYQKTYPIVHLIRQSDRIGMAKTLNQAFEAVKRDIIVKTDCDSLTKSTDSLTLLISNFQDSQVGGVTGVCTGNELEGAFRSWITKLQIAETRLDSTIVAHATSLLAYRMKAVLPVSPDSVNDDAEEFIKIRREGYKTIVDPNVISVEEVPENFLKRRKQKDRRAEGTIRALFENITLLFNPRYGLYGLIIFPIDFFLLIVSPFLLILDIILLGYILTYISTFILIPYIILISVPVFLFKINAGHCFLAIIDIQLSGLLGTIRALTTPKNAKWNRVRT